MIPGLTRKVQKAVGLFCVSLLASVAYATPLFDAVSRADVSVELAQGADVDILMESFLDFEDAFSDPAGIVSVGGSGDSDSTASTFTFESFVNADLGGMVGGADAEEVVLGSILLANNSAAATQVTVVFDVLVSALAAITDPFNETAFAEADLLIEGPDFELIADEFLTADSIGGSDSDAVSGLRTFSFLLDGFSEAEFYLELGAFGIISNDQARVEVPEPSMLLLMFLGLIAVGLRQVYRNP